MASILKIRVFIFIFYKINNIDYQGEEINVIQEDNKNNQFLIQDLGQKSEPDQIFKSQSINF